MPNDISLIPKDYKEEKFSFKTIFPKMGILVIGLVVFSLLVYGGLFFYNKSLNNQIDEFKTQIEEINNQRDNEFEANAKSLDSALKSLKKVLENHLYWSNIFSKIEELTVPQVNFLDFKGTLEEDGSVKLTLSGITLGYTYLAKQMVSFGQEELVSGIKVSGISLGTEGGVEFDLDINFLKDILLK